MTHQKDHINKDKIPWGVQNNGLVSRIYAKKLHFQMNEPIPIYYEIKNVSNETQVIWHSGFWPNHRIIVTNSSGELVSPTNEGRIKLDALSPRGSRRKNVPFDLEKGETDSAWSPYDITKHYVMDLPGPYYIQYTYENYHKGWKGKLKSNILRVLVEE